MIRWLFNQWANRHPYKTEWVEGLPDPVSKNTVYVIGETARPFQVAVVCPRKYFQQVIHLDVAPELPNQWRITVHPDETLSLHPSIHVTGCRCRCHYWFLRGKIYWSEAPLFFVPKENRHVSQG
ncbi:MAG: DUF6527 family protein [Aestuariivita sp.]|nr:DUF6527 family protein [Aestuariivita sp.]MCY4347290.1 DUF6527 family protein [Aestuariivita sp.]